MAKSRSLHQAVRFALASAAAGVSALHAQEAPAPAASPAPVEEVVVTGSRLSTPNETSVSPITSVSAVDLQQTGLTRVEDVLNNLPMVFAGMNSTTSNGNDGTATVDLRGLGNQRTLVLVDGLRLGPGGGGGRNYSDINQIPAALIERVDVLTGGASAVYGADAVAGVVNFILNTHFEGIKVDAGYHFNEHDNSNQAGVNAYVTEAGDYLPSGRVDTAFGKNGSVIMGSNFADNRGNATAYVTYDNQGAALQSQFDYSACTLGIASINPNSLFCAGSGTAAKNGAGGRFLAFSKSGVPILDNTVDGLTGQFRPFTATDEYNYGPLNYYQIPNERWTAGGFMNYDVNSHVNVYTQIMFMRNNQTAQIAASGDFGDFDAFIPCANPLLTSQERTTLCSAANLAAQGNPSESVGGVTYPGLIMSIRRRNVEGGPRIANFINDSMREVLGIKGDFGDNASAWTYNAYVQHSTVDGQVNNENYLSYPLIQEALNVLPTGPNGAAQCGTGPTTLANPTGGFTADANCVPWNIWKANGVTKQALAFMSVPENEATTVSEYLADASVTGDLGKYGVKTPWADSGLQANIGIEWRQDNSADNPDYISEQGTAAGTGGPTPALSGEVNVRELFTELRMPLASHVPGAEDLSVEGGYRYSKYGQGFDTNTWKLGLEWAPIRDVRFRGSYQRAVRAPNIGELYTPQTVGLDGSVDPCAVATIGQTPQATEQQCIAAGVKATQYGKVLANSAQQYNGLLGGNPDLQPEIADTYTVGLVLQPTFVPNMTLSVDYFNIKINNVISAIGENTILLDCIQTLSEFCNDIHRDSTGSLWLSRQGYVTDTVVNEGQLRTSGIDVKASYRLAMTGLGSLLFSLEGTHLQDLITTPVPGGGSYDCKGLYGPTCGANNPNWKSVFNVTWSTPWDGLDVNLRWRYIGGSTSESSTSNPFLSSTSFYPPLAHIPAFSYFDLTTTFNVYKNVRLELGVNNIADKVPPIVPSDSDCSTASPAGANCNGNTYPGVYDAMGRYVFAHITAQF
jgi:iron complex outermembrane recepter protein